MAELKKVTRTMHIVAYKKGYRAEGESAYGTYLTSSKSSLDDTISLGTTEVVYEIPTDDADFDAKLIEVLKAKKQKIIADSRMEQQRIDDEINSLLALPHLESVS